jgi:hypothetical protein
MALGTDLPGQRAGRSHGPSHLHALALGLSIEEFRSYRGRGCRTRRGTGLGGFIMSATPQKPYKKRSSFVTFERDVVSATVDVSVTQLRGSVGAQFPAAAGTPWDKFVGGCGSGTCSGLAHLADQVADLTSVPKKAVSWVIAGLLHSVGCPPFVAQIIGRMVANWLLQPLSDIDPVVRAIRLLGVAVCAESGDLGDCPCLVDLAWQVGQSELKVEIDKGLDLSTGKPAEPREPILRPVEKVERPRPRPAETAERTGDRHLQEAEAAAGERTTPSEGRWRQASDRGDRTSHPRRPAQPGRPPGSPRFPEPPEAGGRTGPHESPDTPEPPDGGEPPEPPDYPGPKWPPDPPETGPEGGGAGPEGGGSGPRPAQPKPGLVKLKGACEATRGDVVPPIPQIFGPIR